MSGIAVAVVSYNTRELLERCLESVRRESPREFVVVDNASTDGSAEMVRTRFATALLFANSSNPGYGAAANQAVAGCHAEYILLLNADTVVCPGTLPTLCTFMDAHSKVGMLGPRILNVDGTLQPSCFPFPTPLDIFLDVSNLTRLIRFLPGVRESYLRTWSHSHARPVPWVMGAGIVIRRCAFDAAGGFDESFHMFYEEADLCYRLQKLGWQVHFAPVAEIVHIGGASTRQARAEMAVQFYTSLMQFYRHHYTRMRQAELIVLVQCIALARWARDSLLSSLTTDPERRVQLAANKKAWRRVARGEWR